ncbi:MAG TPA: SRPBCC family protein [Acidimicrobiales bacterium]|jgi:uncharacterized membrane protein|nr:SRPBCC family protein [Acidimicrobiales bacterium]
MLYEESIEIDAPTDVVWSVLADVERWPSWTASMASVELDAATLEVGAKARIRQPKLPTVVWEVTAVVPGRSFRWESASPGISTVADHVVAPRAGGGSTVKLSLRQEGAAAFVARLLFSGITRRYIRMEAHGLRRRSEELAATLGQS